ncbi:hypothetical protein [Mesorhizobium sp. B2-7-2]|uniref:hypothetical protein n=1 Tax=Mesorhizobium sp. B2-7-2 TaxID=2589908 RepID=UPI001128488B|nr:hypothetical protein [Mesorhizobium sp. B2-7-2]TPJ30199.1 hypothetical protein FJ425_05615 [Mesorhizobium sp. B2-7-2]
MTGMARLTVAGARALSNQFTFGWRKGALLSGVFVSFEAIVKRRAGTGYEGWFARKPNRSRPSAPPLEITKVGHNELLRVMAAAGCQ